MLCHLNTLIHFLPGSIHIQFLPRLGIDKHEERAQPYFMLLMVTKAGDREHRVRTLSPKQVYSLTIPGLFKGHPDFPGINLVQTNVQFLWKLQQSYKKRTVCMILVTCIHVFHTFPRLSRTCNKITTFIHYTFQCWKMSQQKSKTFQEKYKTLENSVKSFYAQRQI